MIGDTNQRGCRLVQRCSVLISTLFCDAGGQESRQEGREDQEEGSAQLLSGLAYSAPQLGHGASLSLAILAARPTFNFETKPFVARISCRDCRANCTLW